MRAIESADRGRPGVRLTQLGPLDEWLGPKGAVGSIAAKWLGPCSAPVRAILFNKNASSNWALGWHQDRTIAVANRAYVDGFDNWNRKDGIDHVEPPFETIQRMITIRLHLDDVTEANAPLLIAPGTHLRGRIKEREIESEVARHGTVACLAKSGDVWAYRTAILHASKRATAPGRRRVLQIDYSADDLPAPLSWHLRP